MTNRVRYACSTSSPARCSTSGAAWWGRNHIKRKALAHPFADAERGNRRQLLAVHLNGRRDCSALARRARRCRPRSARPTETKTHSPARDELHPHRDLPRRPSTIRTSCGAPPSRNGMKSITRTAPVSVQIRRGSTFAIAPRDLPHRVRRADQPAAISSLPGAPRSTPANQCGEGKANRSTRSVPPAPRSLDRRPTRNFESHRLLLPIRDPRPADDRSAAHPFPPHYRRAP